MTMSAAVSSSAVCYFHASELLMGTEVIYDFSDGLPNGTGFTVTDPFRCPRHPECNAHYAPERGYFGAWSDGERLRYESYGPSPSCDHDGRTPYMFQMHENGKLVWACPVEGCSKRVQPSAWKALSRQTTRNPANVPPAA
jgi:hypothetical protein